MLSIKHKETEFAVGDQIRVTQRIKEGDKERLAAFMGMVIGIKGRMPLVTFTVRRIGEAGVGIEKIYPVSLPTIEKIEVLKKGGEGVRHSKLYYTRTKSPREIDSIYSRTFRKSRVEVAKKTASKSAERSVKKVDTKI
ncbi:50S ribosomal protein L19 [Candidatus Woesebacteria bacterium]|nr:50S ribosomal protein L19 [Candidatus Woesebacteria bacterium]